MRSLPEPPGTPDHRSPDRYLLWLARRSWPSLAWSGAVSGGFWVCLTLMSATLGAAVDSGIAGGGTGALLRWSALLAGLAALGAVLVLLSHRADCFNWYASAYRTVQVVTGRSVRLGPTLTRRLPSGEVVAVGTDDIDRVGEFSESASALPGALVSVAVISALMLDSHVTFGLIVLVSVPLILVGMVPLLRVFSQRQEHHRDRQAELTTRSTDLVAGLRVLRGVGGERTVGDRYAAESQRVRAAGVRVGWADAALQSVRELLPGLLLVGIVWYGARLALSGEISVGQLVAFYGYTGGLATAVRQLMRVASAYVSARVAAARVVRVLRLAHDHPDPEHPAAEPAAPCDLRDPASGVAVPALRTTGVVCPDPTDATAIAERLGRYRDGAGGEADAVLVERATGRAVRLRDLPRSRVRERILVATNSAHLFSGRLRDELSPDGGLSDDALARVVHAANADDIVRQSPSGFDAVLTERGREYSGGQQQRLRLARALALDPEILVLVEPASAVDAHSEAAIAAALPVERAGRTTALVTTSPLLLDRTDHVQFVERGRVVAQGTHRALLASVPRYAETVLRTVTTGGNR
ncbi:ABC-type multidrug transport system fused ATPase/permease subunit [Nocardiopsis sp. Huas11]|uniref:ABC transporter transmembrane domain-containing protein n=1 Tax=Nocardiopsis sp. Huas11 TaxID=2183912 RepID=UPI000EAFE7DE|nr:ABC transporter ATP-binding protein [Nocardiopsis sp. Huas11]RKS05862.1 ABC-type multidrug transport system fused ATPase/permease subunit [Nocardiopsis sp. Huas11]